LADLSLASFSLVAASLFVTELTDKDSLLLIAISTRVRVRLAFLAGASAFVITTTVIVLFGSLLVSLVPVYWVRAAGGTIMLLYGLWEARGLLGQRVVQEQESRIAEAGSPWKVFIALVVSLALLDLAGDATEVLTIVYVARYGSLFFVFAAVCTGLLSATAVETTLGSRLGKLLTPRRLRIGSAAIFVALGVYIIFLSSMP
jgi:putative Ca2+/H+ antiporter (TMEM165/GDT1 family)